MSDRKDPICYLTEKGFYDYLVEHGMLGLADTYARGYCADSTPEQRARAERLRREIQAEENSK